MPLKKPDWLIAQSRRDMCLTCSLPMSSYFSCSCALVPCQKPHSLHSYPLIRTPSAEIYGRKAFGCPIFDQHVTRAERLHLKHSQTFSCRRVPSGSSHASHSWYFSWFTSCPPVPVLLTQAVYLALLLRFAEVHAGRGLNLLVFARRLTRSAIEDPTGDDTPRIKFVFGGLTLSEDRAMPPAQMQGVTDLGGEDPVEHVISARAGSVVHPGEPSAREADLRHALPFSCQA